MAPKKKKRTSRKSVRLGTIRYRPPKTLELFNRLISPTLMLREIDKRIWEIETFCNNDDGTRQRITIILKHTTLIQLGLSIVDAVKFADNRFDSE